jgi:Bacterial PH domain
MKTYKSALGRSIVLPLGLLLASVLTLSITLHIWPAVIIIVGCILFVVYLYSTTSYSITPDRKLKIKGGFLVHMEIPIEQIRRIAPSRNPLAAPAFSLDRLEVFYGKGSSVLISPVNKEAFIQDLKAVNSRLAVESLMVSSS